MNTSGLVRRGVSVLLLTAGAWLSAWPQVDQSPPQSGNAVKMEETKFYADAHPYLDEPLPKLKKIVPGLNDVKPTPTEEQLTEILAKVGAKSDELLHKVPDLISDEDVIQTQGTEPPGVTSTCVGRRCGTVDRLFGNQNEKEQKFNFIILSHPAQGGRPVLEEYRISRNGKPLPPGTDAPQFRGFVSTWIVFSPFNQAEARFRYLGEQKIDGHSTFVVAFAQVPGSVEHPGRILSDNQSVPMLLQGIAWIEQSDSRILRLRTDILAPQPEIDLQKQTVDIRFGRVRIPKINLELWLPQKVAAEMKAKGQFVQEQHQYFRYRLYQVKSKIIF